MNFPIWIGALIGYALADVRGLLMGMAIGYFVGRFLVRSVVTVTVGRFSNLQTQFLDSTFAVMGALCKADGQVSADEIRVAEALFDQLRLSPDAREGARHSFNRGKETGFDLDAEVARFADAAQGQRLLHQMFLQVQLSAITADGSLHPAEHAMLLRIARGLGMNEAEVASLEALLRGGSGGRERDNPSALDDAYRALGVPPTASDADVKRAYRKLMSENHPDKLAAKGLPESMRPIAERKTREITGAWERIERARRGAAQRSAA